MGAQPEKGFLSKAFNAFHSTIFGLAVGAIVGCIFSHPFLTAFGMHPLTDALGFVMGDALGTLDWGANLSDWLGFDMTASEHLAHAGHNHGAFDNTIAQAMPATAPSMGW